MLAVVAVELIPLEQQHQLVELVVAEMAQTTATVQMAQPIPEVEVEAAGLMNQLNTLEDLEVLV